MSVPRLISVADDHCALNFNPGVPLTVTPDAPASVVCPAPVCKTIICVPVGNATDEFNGTVMVLALATRISTIFEASDNTRV